MHTDTPAPIRYCACGNPIGDGDYASGHRTCVIHRSRRASRAVQVPLIPRPRR